MKLLRKILPTTLALTLMTSTVFAGNNRITINSKNSDGVELKGFEYIIESDKLKEPVKVDFNDNTSFVLDNLEDGTYHIKETKTVEGYEKGKDYKIELPTEDGHTSVKLTPKHVRKQKPSEKQFTKTNAGLSIATMGSALLLVITLGLALFDNEREEK